MELAEIRPQIDAVNQEMLALFERRMALCRENFRPRAGKGNPRLGRRNSQPGAAGIQPRIFCRADAA